MNFFDAVILGIVEGVTEFLPVSSTGHLVLAAEVLGLPSTEFLKTFEIAIQLGAILSVVVLYFHTLVWSAKNFALWKRVFAAFLPTAVLGLLFYKTVKNFLGSESIVLWALFLGGIFLVVFEMWHERKFLKKFPSPSPEGEVRRGSDISTLPLKTAFFVGLFQAVAMIPGVSRSGATIVGGLLLGLERKTIVEFSFLLAIPTMAAATGLDIFKNASAFTQSDFSLLLVGFVVSFLVALVSIKTFLRFIQSHSFIAFGIYRIFAAIFFSLFFFF